MPQAIHLATAISAFAISALARPIFPDRIPNGRASDSPSSGLTCLHLGHEGCVGGAARNSFGLDFKAAGLAWTRELCMKDSDADGFSNGQELGDPCCEWSVDNMNPRGFRVTNLSHPGDGDEAGTDMPGCEAEVTQAVTTQVQATAAQTTQAVSTAVESTQDQTTAAGSTQAQTTAAGSTQAQSSAAQTSTTVKVAGKGPDVTKPTTTSETTPASTTVEVAGKMPDATKKPAAKCHMPTEKPAAPEEPTRPAEMEIVTPEEPKRYIQVYQAAVKGANAGEKLMDNETYCPDDWFPSTGFTLRCVIEEGHTAGAKWFLDGRKVKTEKYQPYTIMGDRGGVSKPWKRYPTAGATIGCEVDGKMIKVAVTFACSGGANEKSAVDKQSDKKKKY